jgi:hypothetical protein
LVERELRRCNGDDIIRWEKRRRKSWRKRKIRE